MIPLILESLHWDMLSVQKIKPLYVCLKAYVILKLLLHIMIIHIYSV